MTPPVAEVLSSPDEELPWWLFSLGDESGLRGGVYLLSR